MDIASVVGLIGALVLIVMAMGDPGPFMDTASILIGRQNASGTGKKHAPTR